MFAYQLSNARAQLYSAYAGNQPSCAIASTWLSSAIARAQLCSAYAGNQLSASAQSQRCLLLTFVIVCLLLVLTAAFFLTLTSLLMLTFSHSLLA